MELRNFISRALLDIIGAVQDAQDQAPVGSVVPKLVYSFQTVEHGISEIQAVEFEVAVSAGKQEAGEAKLNVVAAIVGGGIKGETRKTGGHVATLKFRIPIRLPSSKAQEPSPEQS